MKKLKVIAMTAIIILSQFVGMVAMADEITEIFESTTELETKQESNNSGEDNLSDGKQVIETLPDTDRTINTTEEEVKPKAQDQSTRAETDKVDLSLTTVNPEIEEIESGKSHQYYINVVLSGLDSHYNNPYQIITISKRYVPSSNYIQLGESESVVSKEITEDNDNIFIKIGYSSLVGGTAISLPVSFATYNLRNGEEYSIAQQLYTNVGELLATKENIFRAQASVIRADNQTFDRLVNLTDITDDNFINDGIEFNAEFVYYRYQNGQDRRDLQLSAKLDDKMIFEPSGGLSYDEATHTVSKVISSGILSTPFKFKTKGVMLSDKLAANFTVAAINDDGTIDESTRSTATTTVYFKTSTVTPPNPEIEKNPIPTTIRFNTGTEFEKFSEESENKIREVTLTGDVQASEDNKAYSFYELSIGLIDYQNAVNGYSLTYGGDFSENPEELASLQKNTLYGISRGGKAEVIAENIPITSEKSYIDIPKKSYYRFYVKFDSPVVLKRNADKQIQLHVKTSLLDYAYEELSGIFESASVTEYRLDVTGLIRSEEGNGVDKAEYFIKSEGALVYEYFLTSSLDKNPAYTNIPFGFRQSFKQMYRYFDDENQIPDFKNLQFVLLLPDGYEFVDFKKNDGVPVTSYKTVYDLKGTGKTAIVANMGDPEGKISTYIDFTVKANPNAIQGKSSFISYLVWDNTGKGIENIDGSSMDNLDLNENGDVTDRIAQTQTSVNLLPGKELFLKKSAKKNSDSGYRASDILIEGNDVLDYELSIFNNSIIDVKNIDMIDVLPYQNDTSIIPNGLGEYTSRGSDFKIKLSGPITEVPGYLISYSTDTPKKTLQENKETSTWQTSDQIADFSKVTMIRLTARPETTVSQGEEVKFHYSAKTPASAELEEGQKAVSSFAAMINQNPDNAVESLGVIARAVKYQIAGTVYNDQNKDSTQDAEELGLSDYKVEVYDESDETKLIGQTMTDEQGKYVINAEIAGNYLVKIKLKNGDIVSEYKASKSGVVNNDVDNKGQANVTLDINNNQGIVNVALSTISILGKTSYLDETGASLADAVVQTIKPSSSFVWQAPLVFKDKELDLNLSTYVINKKVEEDSLVLTGLALQKNSTAIETKTLVELMIEYQVLELTDLLEILNKQVITEPTECIELNYVYTNVVPVKATVTVHHVDETGAKLYEDQILDGTDKIGETYETKAQKIEGYELIKTPENASGVYTAGTIEVTYIYKNNADPATKTQVIVHHVDEKGTKLSGDVILEGKIGEAYETTGQEITGYKLKEVPSNAKGSYTAGTIEVTYIYKKNAEPAKKTQVIVHHVDEKGNKLSDDVILNGKIGEAYATTRKEIKGYKVKEIPNNAKGNYLVEPVEVTYVYTKNSTTITDPGTDKTKTKPVQMSNQGNTSKATSNSAKKLPQTNELTQNFSLLSFALIVLSGATYLRRRKVK